MTRLSWAYFRAGLADGQIVEQFTQVFDEYTAAHQPDWGHVVIAAGVIPQAFEPVKGDLNLYWWWSGSDRADWIEHYVSHASVKPAAILCTSLKMYEFVKAKGYKCLYLGMAAGRDFYPLDCPRARCGYCGTQGHKEGEQIRVIVEPAREYGLEWLVQVPGGRRELNEKYNSWAVCLGMTATITQWWGIVPNRTFDVLATASPYLTYTNPAMEDTLGFPYPYQSSTPEDTRKWIDELTRNWPAHKAEFAVYSGIIRRRHTWANRMQALADFIDKEL